MLQVKAMEMIQRLEKVILSFIYLKSYSNEKITTGDAVDDIEEGKGVDEELSLLPDAEREISDADKERALQAEKDAAKESTKTNDNDQAAEINLIDNEDDASECPDRDRFDDKRFLKKLIFV